MLTRANRTFLYITSMASLLITPHLSNADNEKKNYTQAYYLCSPVAHQISKRRCNYGVVFEDYYIKCMHSQGYHEDEEVLPSYFENYLASHNYCSSISDQNTKNDCSYGNIYNSNYNSCMSKYGFNENGEKVSQSNTEPHFEFNF